MKLIALSGDIAVLTYFAVLFAMTAMNASRAASQHEVNPGAK